MKTRIIQDDQAARPDVQPADSDKRAPRVKNVAARMGHWSATHRKTAIWGWLAFVVLAVLIGSWSARRRSTGPISSPAKRGAPSRRWSGAGTAAEHGARLHPEQPSSRSATRSSAARSNRPPTRLEQADARRSTSCSPLTGGAPVSADGHSALVDFEITGDDLRATDRLDPSRGAVAAVKARASRAQRRPVRRRQHEQGAQRHLRSRISARPRCSRFPVTLLILVVMFGSGRSGARAAAAGNHHRGRGAGAGRAP